MASPKAIRKLAFQALFQLDARGGPDDGAVRETLNDLENFTDADRDKAYALALAAFNARDMADRDFVQLAPAWPAHRQPAADRAALRLGHYELTSRRVPPKVAVNEAVELAKIYGSEKSPAFVNGLLDRVLRRLAAEKTAQADHHAEPAADQPANLPAQQSSGVQPSGEQSSGETA